MDTVEAPVAPKISGWNVFTAVAWSEGTLAWASRLLTTSRYEALESRIQKAGHFGLLAAAGLGLFCGIAGALKWDQLSPLLIGVAWLPCVGVAQYIAVHFAATSRDLIQSNETRLALNAFLKSIALWCLLLGVTALLSFTFIAIRLDSFSLFCIGIGVFLIFELVAWLCLNPSLLNIRILPAATTWEEATGILAFYLKAPLRLVPMVFGLGVIVGDFAMLAALINLFRGDMDSMAGAQPAAVLVVGSAVLPLVAYVLFHLNYLWLDLARALLSIPGKLDAIGKK